jgi:hypothetical protein
MNRLARGLFIAALTALLLSGCSVWSGKYGYEKPHISFVLPNSEFKDRLYVWNPNTTAAYVSSTGGFCISSADVFKSRDLEFDANLKASALENIDGLDAVAKTKLLETVTKIAEKDAAGTFLGVALFNICMISQNKNLSADQTHDLVVKALDAAASIARDAAAPDK